MAELLIKAVDATIPDPTKDQRGCYKRGDIVVVMPDGHTWGKEEGLPKFVIVKIPGLSVAAVKQYAESEYPLGDRSQKPVRRRRFKVPIDDLPANIKNEALNTGVVTVSKTKVANYVKDKTER